MDFREITPIDRSIAPIEPLVPRGNDAVKSDDEAGQPGFDQLLKQQLDDLISLNNEAEQLQHALAAGEIDDVNRVVLAMQKADLALNFAIEVRNKVIEAYQEISRMQI